MEPGLKDKISLFCNVEKRCVVEEKDVAHSIYEVPIDYHGRTYEEGKKINWRDGVWALWCIIKYNVL